MFGNRWLPLNTCADCAEVQAIFFRRRHQPRRPPLAKMRPGRPAPTMGPGTPTPHRPTGVRRIQKPQRGFRRRRRYQRSPARSRPQAEKSKGLFNVRIFALKSTLPVGRPAKCEVAHTPLPILTWTTWLPLAPAKPRVCGRWLSWKQGRERFITNRPAYAVPYRAPP